MRLRPHTFQSHLSICFWGAHPPDPVYRYSLLIVFLGARPQTPWVRFADCGSIGRLLFLFLMTEGYYATNWCDPPRKEHMQALLFSEKVWVIFMRFRPHTFQSHLSVCFWGAHSPDPVYRYFLLIVFPGASPQTPQTPAKYTHISRSKQNRSFFLRISEHQ
jgi:hypothetical protein